LADLTIRYDDGGLARRLAGADRVVGEELARAVDRTTLAGEAVSKRLAPVDTGHLRRSIARERAVWAGGRALGRWGTNLPYAAPVEEGRRAGAPMPPAGVLLGWMRRHGIPAAAEFPLRRAIGRRGIPAKPYLKPALAQVRAPFRRECEAALARAARRLLGAG
jgi:Bacteriophage HK97-gp10, putative tail-component